MKFGLTTSIFFSNRRSAIKRVNASCAGPVTISEAMMRLLTGIWNCVTAACATTTAALNMPTTSMPTMDSIQGPELMMPA